MADKTNFSNSKKNSTHPNMADDSFHGEKICHPLVMVETTRTKVVTIRRRGESFQKEIESTSRHYGNDMISDDVAHQIQNAELRIKVDGACGYIMYDGTTYHPYCRHDIKYDNKTGDWDPRYVKHNDDGSYTPLDTSYIPCEPNPGAGPGRHWPHWRPVKPKQDKWFHQAFVTMMNEYDLNKLPKSSFTCEYMGNKVNRCESDLLPKHITCAIVPHHMTPTVDISDRSYNGFRNFFMKENRYIEGVVAYCPNGKRYKIRRDMFRDDDDNRLKWPNGPSPNDTSVASTIFHNLLKKGKLSDSE